MLIMQDANNWDIAQVSQEQLDKIMFLINKGQEEGAKLEVGGKRYGNSCLADQVNANQEVHRHAYVALYSAYYPSCITALNRPS